MKYLLAIALLAAAFFPLNAHPARDILLSFDPTTQILHVTFEHSVRNNNDHYIGKVNVADGKQPLIEQLLYRQDNNDSGSVSYKLNSMNVGDTLSVTVECNKGGKLTRTLVVQ